MPNGSMMAVMSESTKIHITLQTVQKLVQDIEGQRSLGHLDKLLDRVVMGLEQLQAKLLTDDEMPEAEQGPNPFFPAPRGK